MYRSRVYFLGSTVLQGAFLGTLTCGGAAVLCRHVLLPRGQRVTLNRKKAFPAYFLFCGELGIGQSDFFLFARIWGGRN